MLGIPFGAVATELTTSREIWLQRGGLGRAIRASIALPGIFSPIGLLVGRQGAFRETRFGPGSPSCLGNVVVTIEQHVEFLTGLIAHLCSEGIAEIDADPSAEAGWVASVADIANGTLLPHANSWYMGANVPGKRRVFLMYIGVGAYRQICDEIAEDGYRGFVMKREQLALAD